jgi:hypothetical protein
MLDSLTGRSSAERNDRESPLLRLPGELRNRIYGYVFDGSILSFVRSLVNVVLSQPIAPGLPLTRVCRKLHKETALVPFKSMVVECSTLDTFNGLVSRLNQAQRQSLTSLRLYVRLHTRDVDNFLEWMALAGQSFSKMFPGVRKVQVYNSLGEDVGYNSAMLYSDLEERNMELLDAWLYDKANKDLQVLWDGYY